MLTCLLHPGTLFTSETGQCCPWTCTVPMPCRPSQRCLAVVNPPLPPPLREGSRLTKEFKPHLQNCSDSAAPHCRPGSQRRNCHLEGGPATPAGPAANHGSVISVMAGGNLFLRVIAPLKAARGPEYSKAGLLSPSVFAGPLLSVLQSPKPPRPPQLPWPGALQGPWLSGSGLLAANPVRAVETAQPYFTVT